MLDLTGALSIGLPLPEYVSWAMSHLLAADTLTADTKRTRINVIRDRATEA